jgi:hypothetical protein
MAKTQMSCYRAIYYNNCTTANCIFSHDEATLRKTWGEIMELLKKSKYWPTHISYVVVAEDLDSNCEKPEKKLDALHENLLVALPEASVQGAANIAGKSLLGDLIIKVEALEIVFDTGASGGNYISETFFAENAICARRKRVHATLANGTVLEFSTTVSLTLKFTYSEGAVHTFTLDFDFFLDYPSLLSWASEAL